MGDSRPSFRRELPVCHPSCSDPTNDLIVVHNGIVTNAAAAFRLVLQNRGHKFETDMDSRRPLHPKPIPVSLLIPSSDSIGFLTPFSVSLTVTFQWPLGLYTVAVSTAQRHPYDGHRTRTVDTRIAC